MTQQPPDDPFEDLCEEFASALRQGRRPSLDAYLARCPPELRGQLRDRLTLLAELHRLDAPEPGEPRAGQFIDDFDLLAEIARGGMGVVFVAWQRSLARRVALKVLLCDLPPVAGEEAVNREATTLAKLRHAHIVPVITSGRVRGRWYYVMELIPGGRNLLDALPELTHAPKPGGVRKRSWAREAERRIAAVVGHVAAALAHAHGKGVLHLDVKPVNLLWHDSTVWLTDFGLAALGEPPGEPPPGAPGTRTRGTTGYIAPERYQGVKDGRCDVFSLGVTLYELLAEALVEDPARRAEAVARIKSDAPPPPRALLPGLSWDLAAVVRRMTHRDPKSRYQSAADVEEDLRRFCDTPPRPVAARPRGWPERVGRWALRHPAVAVGSSLFVAVALVAFYQWARAEKANVSLAYNNYAKDVNLAQRECRERKYEQAARRLDECPEECRGWEYDYLRRLAGRSPRRLAGHQGFVRGVAFSQDSGTLASGDGLGAIRFWDSRSGGSLGAAAGRQDGPARALSYGGQLVASSGERRLTLVHKPGTNEQVMRLPDAGASAALSPDGKLLATDAPDGKVWLWSVPEGRRVRELGGACPHVKGVAFSPDGAVVAAASRDRVRLWRLADGRETLVRRDADAAGNCNVAFSPDSKSVCGTTDGASHVCVWAVATGEQVERFAATTPGWSHVVCVAFGTGERLAFRDAHGNVTVRDLRARQSLRVHRGPGRKAGGDLAFSPDGRRLAWGEGADVFLFDFEPATAQTEVVLRDKGPSVGAVAWSRDGLAVVAGHADRQAGRCTYDLWDVATECETQSVVSPGLCLLGVRFRDDGALLTIDRRADRGAGSVRSWDAKTAKPADETAFESDGERAEVTPDGRLLLLPVGREVRVVALGDGATLRKLPHDGAAACLAVSGDGRRLLTGGADHVGRLWRIDTGELLAAFHGHEDRVNAVALSPDGGLAATAGCDGTVRVWDTNSGRERFRMNEHHGEVAAVCFSRDGRRVASGGADGLVKIWDVATGRELLSLEGHRAGVCGVAFDPAGGRLLSAGQDGSLRIWDGRPLPAGE